MQDVTKRDFFAAVLMAGISVQLTNGSERDAIWAVRGADALERALSMGPDELAQAWAQIMRKPDPTPVPAGPVGLEDHPAFR